MARRTRTGKWKQLTRRDVPKCDDYAVKAVLFAMAHGAVGRVTNRGHVMIKHDGQIMSVAPDTRKSRQVIAIQLRDLFGEPFGGR